MMTRKDVIRQVAAFSGPLGPLESVADRKTRREKWVTATESEITELLLEVLMHPPEITDLRPTTRDEFEAEIAEILAISGQRDPSGLLQRVGALLGNDKARPTLIETIGALRKKDGISWLRALFDSTELTEDELARLACALGEIGGMEARDLLKRMRLSVSQEIARVHREIDIALERA